MLKPMAGPGRLQVGQEQVPERFLGGGGAEQPEHRFPCGVVWGIMEMVEAAVQVEIALLGAAGALHQLQRRVHAASDEERLDGGVRVVAGLDAPPGEDAPAGVVGEERLQPQLCPVLPFDWGSARMEQGIDAAWREEDAHGAGVADLHGLRAQLLDLPGVVEEGQGHRYGFSGLEPLLECSCTVKKQATENKR